jgi:hypothetical protein
LILFTPSSQAVSETIKPTEEPVKAAEPVIAAFEVPAAFSTDPATPAAADTEVCRLHLQ